MQTFLPYNDIRQSVKSLDNKRLGKQRIETWQIYQALINPNNGWRNHPIVRMWFGYEKLLLYYGHVCCLEWCKRGFKDTMDERIHKEYYKIKPKTEPPWLGNEDFHASHRSNLLRKDPKWYGQFGWKEPNNLPYVWFK